jgi:DNA-binding MarR family transcriptional regulator
MERLAEARACLGFALRRAARVVARRFDSALRRSGLRATQFNLLVVLDALGPVTMTELAVAMAVDRTTLTRNLALLATKGWVRGAPGPDRRSRRVVITAEGRRAAVKALATWRKAQESLRRELGAVRFGQLAVQLQALAQG